MDTCLQSEVKSEGVESSCSVAAGSVGIGRETRFLAPVCVSANDRECPVSIDAGVTNNF